MSRSIYALLASLSLALPASAQTVELNANAARGALTAASLLLALDDDAVPQDYVAAARADYRRLLTALYATGYYGGTVSILIDGQEAAEIEALAALAQIDKVTINVQSGARFRFGSVQIAPLPEGGTLPPELAPREIARASLIGDAVDAAIAQWRDQGFAKASVASQRISAAHENRQLNVAVGIDTGPRLSFGPLSVRGNADVRAERIAEIAGLPEGEVFSPDTMRKVEGRLRRTGAFDSVTLSEADDIGPNNTLPMSVLVAESKPRRIGFGAEISSTEGLALSGYWLHRNLLGGAERLRIEGQIAGLNDGLEGADYALTADFGRPATFGPDTDLYLSAGIARENAEAFRVDSISLGAGLSFLLSDDLVASAGVDLRRASEESDLGSRTYSLLSFPLSATLDRRDNATDATSGYYVSADLTPFISSDQDLAGTRLWADARGYYALGEEANVTFAARGQIGSVLGAEVGQTPADYLFYSGGGGTVRGVPYQSLGLTSGGDTTGGTSFIGAQLEARVAVRDAISLVGFYDVGYVGGSATPATDGDWHAGIGAGLRYDTAIGPIRLDLGTPARGDDAFGSVQVYIGIGQAF